MANAISSFEVKKQLTEMILSGEIPPGTIISEGHLAEQFDVSRTPVREAIRQLAAIGLIELRPRQRSIVKRLSLGDALDRFETLSILESACCEMAARRRTEAELEQIEALHAECGKYYSGDDVDTYFEVNERFHEAIFRASGNQYLADEAMRMRAMLRTLRMPRSTQPERMGESYTEHEEIMRALRTQNTEAARDAMREHVIMIGEKLNQFVHDYEAMVRKERISA